MKNKVKKSGVILIIVILVILNFVPRKSEKILNNTNEKGVFSNRLSMMLENESGDYVATTAEEWPTTAYKFNSKLSKCANGGKVSWDFANKRVKMTGASSDKCFIYFDKIVTVDSYCDSGDNLASCIKTYGNAGYDKSSIYIHNSSLTNGAGDNSYRFAGASDYVNNFVCFGSDASTCPTDNLYRIIGVFGDQVKLIKYDYVTSALLGTDGDYKMGLQEAITNLPNHYTPQKYMGSKSLSDIALYNWNMQYISTSETGYTNIWSNSKLNTINLNENFIASIDSKWSNMINSTTWKTGGNSSSNIALSSATSAYQNEIVSPAQSTTYSAKIGLMYVSDYGYAVNSKYWTRVLCSVMGAGTIDYSFIPNENWLFMGIEEWTITRVSDSSNFCYDISRGGAVYHSHGVTDSYAVRPTFYLKSSIKYAGGKGIKESPIRLS